MKKLALMAVLGGVLIAVGVYLFPMYVGQEIFINWLADVSGGGYWMGVIWAGVIASFVIIVGLFLIKPQVFSLLGNPILTAGALIILIMFVNIMLSLGGSG